MGSVFGDCAMLLPYSGEKGDVRNEASSSSECIMYPAHDNTARV